ncbi:hypothetical protein [Sphingomonas sp.]|uniref:hypothetical protein n=1 Tax=Sphingomonas sp. TaxID=28214 RepID=UPI003B3A6FDB
MPTASSILVHTLVALAVGPLLLVGILFLLTYFNLPTPMILIDAIYRTMLVQSTTGALVNVVLGMAAVAGAVWLPIHDPSGLHLILAPLLFLFGLWRLWRGVTVLPIDR